MLKLPPRTGRAKGPARARSLKKRDAHSGIAWCLTAPRFA